MKTSLPRLTFALIFMATIISLTCMEAKAQSDVFTYLFHGGTYENESQREALYTSNAELPLGGLFAPGFTRTLTFLGGVNYPSSGVDDAFSSVAPPSFIGFPLGSELFSPPLEIDDSGYAVSFAFGRRHSRKLRSEIEVAFRSNDINDVQVSPLNFFNAPPLPPSIEQDGSINATSILKNFIVEYENITIFTPYVGAGIGLSYVDLEFGEATSVDGEPTFQDGAGAFTYQAIGGVSTQLNSFSDFIVEYRFLGTSEIDFAGLDDSFAYNASTLFLGVKFEY